MQDHLCDFSSNLKVAVVRRKSSVLLVKTKLIYEICKVFYLNGYISGLRVFHNHIEIYLRYHSGLPVLKLSQVSKRSKRVFYNKKNLQFMLNHSNYLILSSKGPVLCTLGSKPIIGGEVLYKF